MNSAHKTDLGIQCLALPDPSQNADTCGSNLPACALSPGTPARPSVPREKVKLPVRTQEVIENKRSHLTKNPPNRTKTIQKPYIFVLFSTQKPELNPQSSLPHHRLAATVARPYPRDLSVDERSTWSGPPKSENTKRTHHVVENKGSARKSEPSRNPIGTYLEPNRTQNEPNRT
jgi:hypothetical protein